MTLSVSLTRSPDWRGRRAYFASWSAPWGGTARWFACGPFVLFVRAYKKD